MEKEVSVSALEPHIAARLLRGSERFDPRGMATGRDLETMARNGHCFVAAAGDDLAVYVLNESNGVTWINACQGRGAVPWREVLLPVIEQQAKGCESVAFQTARPGLVRAAERQGYEVAGWIMKKKIQ